MGGCCGGHPHRACRDKGSSHMLGNLRGPPWVIAFGSPNSHYRNRTYPKRNQPTRNVKNNGHFFLLIFWQIIKTKGPFKRAMLNFLKGQDLQILLKKKKKRPSLCDSSFSEGSSCDGGDVGKADGLEILLSGLCLYLLNTFRTCLSSVYQYGSRVSAQAPASGPSIS